ncbi:MAG: NifU family protein [Candidatus Eisenbacteria bacterium]|nr:NifU family protein [Candidatus Eisenbacteria bacterium]
MLDREEVVKVLEERVKPALTAHGGGVDLVDVKDNKVYVRLTGACHSCPMALMTLKAGVERALRQAFPDLEEVVSV